MDKIEQKGFRKAMISETELQKLKIGFKEVTKLIAENRAGRVIVAQDCEDKIKNPLFESAKKFGIELEYAPNMRELGKLCGIDIGASCAAVAKF